MSDFEPFAEAPDPSEAELAPVQGQTYQPWPERPLVTVIDEPPGMPVEHRRWKDRFYVVAGDGSVGMVPWPGSHVVWKWERAWIPDLNPGESYLKPGEKPKR